LLAITNDVVIIYTIFDAAPAVATAASIASAAVPGFAASISITVGHFRVTVSDAVAVAAQVTSAADPIVAFLVAFDTAAITVVATATVATTICTAADTLCSVATANAVPVLQESIQHYAGLVEAFPDHRGAELFQASIGVQQQPEE
jgi:hypothetical protein